VYTAFAQVCLSKTLPQPCTFANRFALWLSNFFQESPMNKQTDRRDTLLGVGLIAFLVLAAIVGHAWKSHLLY
jgi:hypothetical protein